MSQKHKVEKDYLTKKGTLWKYYCTNCFTGWKNKAGKTECAGNRTTSKTEKKEKVSRVKGRSGLMRNANFHALFNAGAYKIETDPVTKYQKVVMNK